MPLTSTVSVLSPPLDGGGRDVGERRFLEREGLVLRARGRRCRAGRAPSRHGSPWRRWRRCALSCACTDGETLVLSDRVVKPPSWTVFENLDHLVIDDAVEIVAFAGEDQLAADAQSQHHLRERQFFRTRRHRLVDGQRGQRALPADRVHGRVPDPEARRLVRRVVRQRIAVGVVEGETGGFGAERKADRGLFGNVAHPVGLGQTGRGFQHHPPAGNDFRACSLEEHVGARPIRRRSSRTGIQPDLPTGTRVPIVGERIAPHVGRVGSGKLFHFGALCPKAPSLSANPNTPSEGGSGGGLRVAATCLNRFPRPQRL